VRDRTVLVLSHLFPSSAAPGSGPFVANEVAHLAEFEDVVVVAPVRRIPPLPVAAWKQEREVPFDSVSGGIRVIRPRVLAFPFGGLWAETVLWPRQLRAVVTRLAAEKNASLIHAHFGVPDGWAALQLSRELGVPFVVTLHGSDALVLSRKRSVERLLSEVVRGASRVIAVSSEIADRAIELGARSDKVIVQPCGVPAVISDATDHGAARETLGLLGSEQWILWVGALVDVKQPLHIVDAFARIAMERPNTRLAMVGDGPLRADVDARIAGHGLRERVRRCGHLGRDDVALWQHAADVFCNTSRSEGTPVALMEAAVCGTPVVAYGVGGIPGVVAPEIGRLTRTRQPSELARELSIELSRPRDRDVVRSGASRLRIEHSIQRVLDVHRSESGNG
jgi:glycosyltransferase involved in cell wall biosynthesis